MKGLIYAIAAATLLSLASCNGTREYDTYVETLKTRIAETDTISSAQSYAAFLEKIATEAVAFANKDVKLDEAQKKEISQLGNELQTALTARYEKLAQTPMTLPADFPVEEADTTAIPAK